MRRQNHRAPRVISGIFIGTLLAALTVLFFQAAEIEKAWTKLGRTGSPVRSTKLAGHWLRTGQDSSYSPASLEVEKSSPEAGTRAVEVFQPEAARTAFNRRADCFNIMYLWIDNDLLKVISITSFNKATKQAAIVVIPLHTVVNNSTPLITGNGYIAGPGFYTVQDLYREKGEEALRAFLEQRLDIDIPNLIQVNQTALQKLSDIMGVLSVNDGKITMLEAFEQTAAGPRTDDRNVVRAIASQALQPQILLKLPKLLWVFTHDISTNFSTEQMLGVFYLSRQMDLAHMAKTALPGSEYIKGNLKYLFVPEQTWKNIIYEITQ